MTSSILAAAVAVLSTLSPQVGAPDWQRASQYYMEGWSVLASEPVQAEKDFQQAISVYPDFPLGHYGLVVSSGDERAVLLGDAVECPLQLEEPDLAVLSDVDPALAARTRESMWRELEGTSTQMIGSHFPGLAFGRVLGGQGQRYFATA